MSTDAPDHATADTLVDAPAGPASPIPGRLGILGGTFDPVHLGHLALAEEARDALGLERVLFVVAGDPWQKAGRTLAPAEMRLAMVEAAIGGNPAFQASRLELDRTGPTYTVDTLDVLDAEARARGVGPDLWFLMSADALAGLRTWRDADRILEIARVAVAPRVSDAPAADGSASPAVQGDNDAWARHFAADFPGREGRAFFLDGPRLGISSTAVRARVRAGRSIRYLVPDRVADLIREYALYRPQPAPTPVPVIE